MFTCVHLYVFTSVYDALAAGRQMHCRSVPHGLPHGTAVTAVNPQLTAVNPQLTEGTGRCIGRRTAQGLLLSESSSAKKIDAASDS
jgi:hypothetical protein